MKNEDENKRTAMVSYRVTPSEKDRLLKLAEKRGISLPELGYLAINCIEEEDQENVDLLKNNKGLQELVIMLSENLKASNEEQELLKKENTELREDKAQLTADYNTAFEILKANNLHESKKENQEEDNFFFGGLVKI